MKDRNMQTLQIQYPDGFEQSVGLTSEELEYQIRLMASLKMFELGKISSGKAAELLGTTRVDFFNICGRYKVSIFNYSPDELKKELQADLKTLQEI
jgi:predicted HTH domain antitoxin